MTNAQQMNAARKAVKASVKNGDDRSATSKVAIETLLACGMPLVIVNEMATKAMLDVICGN